MQQLLQQVALALGSGATVAIAGQGIVQIYRGSGVLNFAHGAFALAAAQTFVWLWDGHDVPLALALIAGVGVGSVLGVLTQLIVMRPLREASPLVRIVATVGVLQVVQQGSLLVFGSDQTQVASFLPRGSVGVGSVTIQRSALVLVGVAVALTAGLWSTMRATGFGRATQAVAESHLLARAVGRSPERVAAASWALGGALAALAGILVVPIGGLAVSSILLMAVPAFAAAVLGGFRSYLLTTVGAVVIAAGQSLYTYQSVQWGWPPGVAPALPFLVIALALTVRSGALPARGEAPARLPRVSRAIPRPVPALAAGAVAVAVALLSSDALANTLVTTFVAATVGLSLVLVTGMTGQISLAQYALAGIGALAAARTSDVWGWPFLASLAVGAAAAAAAGVAFALPALRTRGPALAVVTIGLGLAVQQGLLADNDLTGGFNGATPVERPRLAGVEIDAIEHPQRYAALAAVVFTLLAVAVAVLRAGPVGRRLLAVRDNERAAAALGVPVRAVKLYAFVLGAAVAGVGGVLAAFRFDAVQYGQFGFFESLGLVTVVLIGGIGFVVGPLLGALALPGGVLTYLTEGVGDLSRWMVLSSGALLVVVLVRLPDGIVAAATARRASRSGRRAHEVEPPASETSVGARFAGPPQVLDVDELHVSFGGVRVLDGVSLRVRPGTITGLIGANGAGKTTLVDTISGLVRPTGGSIRLGGIEITALPAVARAERGLGRCFQSLELFEDLTVRENLLVALEDVSPGRWLTSLVRVRPTALPPHAVAVIGELALDDVLDVLPGQLSHGQRRLVGVARALVAQPSVLLLDEPAAGLDAVEREHLGHLLLRVASVGVGVLLVDHDVDLVVGISDHVVAIDFGSPIYDGAPGGVAHDEAVRAAYLGVADEPAAAHA